MNEPNIDRLKAISSALRMLGKDVAADEVENVVQVIISLQNDCAGLKRELARQQSLFADIQNALARDWD